jgi:hypothetical protein
VWPLARGATRSGRLIAIQRRNNGPTYSSLSSPPKPKNFAAEANANSVLIQQNPGFLYYRLGMRDATRTAFRNLRALNPDHPSLTLLG